MGLGLGLGLASRSCLPRQGHELRGGQGLVEAEVRRHEHGHLFLLGLRHRAGGRLGVMARLRVRLRVRLRLRARVRVRARARVRVRVRAKVNSAEPLP